MKRTLVIMGCVAGLIAGFVLVGSHGAAAAPNVPALGFFPPPGTGCLVHFRHDAMGIAGQTLPSPLDVAGTSTVRGRLKAMDNEWIVLTTEKGDVFIPMGVVLLVQASAKP